MNALITEGQLASHPFVSGANIDFLNRLEEVSSEAFFEKGDVIFREGEYADRFFLIFEGKVMLVSGKKEDPGSTIQILGPGDALGWSWLFPPFQWHFTAHVVEPCKVVVLNGATLLVRAAEDPVFGYQLMRRVGNQVIERLQWTRKHLRDEARQHATGAVK